MHGMSTSANKPIKTVSPFFTAAVVSLTFLSLINFMGSASTFALYGVLSIVTLVFVRFVVPETCGRELESISVPKTA